MAEVAAAGDETGDGSGCAGDDDLSGSQLRCAQLRPLGIPMGLQGHRQRYTVRDSKRCCSLIMNCGDCYANDNALAAGANAVKASSVVSATSSSLDAAVAACILHADVSAAACLLWLLLVLLLLTLMVMTVVAVSMITSRAHSCAARSCDPSASPWGSKALQGHRQRCAVRHSMRCSSLFVKC